MARRKSGDNKVEAGNITDVSGEVNIAVGDIIENINTLHQRPLATEEGSRARKPGSKRLPRGVGELAWGLAGQVSDGRHGGLLSCSRNQVGLFYERNETK